MAKSGVALVTIKLKKGLKSLRRTVELAVVMAAIARVNAGGDVRIVEFSIMSNHIHLIVEARDSAHLSKGMASFNTGLNTQLGIRLVDPGFSIFASAASGLASASSRRKTDPGSPSPNPPFPHKGAAPPQPSRRLPSLVVSVCAQAAALASQGAW